MSCPSGANPAAPVVPADLAHHATARAQHAEVIADLNALDLFASEWGLSLGSELREKWGALADAGWRAVALVYAPSDTPFWTRTVRIDDDAPPILPLSLTSASSAPIRITAFAIGDHRSTFGTSLPLTIDLSLDPNGAANYLPLRDRLLTDAAGSFLIESAGIGPFWEGIPAPGNLPAATPTIVGTYLERAAAYGDLGGSADVCETSMARWSGSGMSVATACPRGALTEADETESDLACRESLSSGSISPDVFRCVGADDLALAFSGRSPWFTWITRAVGMIGPSQTGEDTVLQPSSDEPKSPFLFAGGSADCIAIPTITTLPPPDPSPPPSDPVPPSGTGSTGDTGSTDIEIWVDTTTSSEDSSGCSGSSSDAVRTDSTDDSSSGSGGSSSDSTEKSSSDDSGCDGSSSDSSNDSSNDSGGCDNSQKQEPEQQNDQSTNDGCSSSHTSSSSSDSSGSSCTVAPHRHRRHRPRTFPVALALVALALPLRRALRRRARAQASAHASTKDTTACTAEGATSTPV
jgi:hypothetical protein